MDVKTWTILYKLFVRSQLEHGVCVWYPYKKYIIDELERVQRRATKMLKQCKNLSYNINNNNKTIYSYKKGR